MTPIDPQGYASLLAHVAYFPGARTDEVLRRLRVDRAAFDDASARVPGELADAAARGDTAKARRFGEAFAAEKKRLEHERPSVESLGPLDDGPTAEPAVEPPQVSPLASEPTEPGDAPIAPSTPHAPTVDAPRYVPSYLRDEGKQAVSVSPPLAPTVPAPPATPAAVRLSVGAVVPLAAVSIQHTTHDDEPSVDSTLPPVPRPQAAKPLPFREGRGGPPPTVALTLPRSRESDPDAGETLGIAGTIVPTAATPFEEAALERWTVERYAAFVADRRIDPAEQARNAYGLANAAEESALLVHMNKRFGSEPGLLARWQALVAARMKQRGRG
jgi:hypothetical protein